MYLYQSVPIYYESLLPFLSGTNLWTYEVSYNWVFSHFLYNFMSALFKSFLAQFSTLLNSFYFWARSFYFCHCFISTLFFSYFISQFLLFSFPFSLRYRSFSLFLKIFAFFDLFHYLYSSHFPYIFFIPSLLFLYSLSIYLLLYI